VQALQSSFIYDRLIISWINDLPQPELAAEVADFLMRFEEVEWAMAAGVYGDKLILSMRSSAPDAKAGDILKKVVGTMGKAGGHDRRAGGTVYLSSTAASNVEEVRGELRKRLLKVLRIEECRGQRLVSRKEMLQNLQA
jgi:nanoRNase/pAp phosphatase (c-di-AMP/oligoRNAs hydrolase)